jgi:hypothetical protein
MSNKTSRTIWDEGPGNPIQAKGINSSSGKGCYEIKVEGQVDPQWSEWLGGLAIYHDDVGNSLITGEVADQAALHGLLVKIRDLGLPLVSLARIECRKE